MIPAHFPFLPQNFVLTWFYAWDCLCSKERPKCTVQAGEKAQWVKRCQVQMCSPHSQFSCSHPWPGLLREVEREAQQPVNCQLQGQWEPHVRKTLHAYTCIYYHHKHTHTHTLTLVFSSTVQLKMFVFIVALNTVDHLKYTTNYDT